MGLFGESNTGQLEALQLEVNKLRDGNKKGSAELAAERLRVTQLQGDLERIRIELDSARSAVLKARKRQKNSVERANRFKAKAVKLVESTASQ